MPPGQNRQCHRVDSGVNRPAVGVPRMAALEDDIPFQLSGKRVQQAGSGYPPLCECSPGPTPAPPPFPPPSVQAHQHRNSSRHPRLYPACPGPVPTLGPDGEDTVPVWPQATQHGPSPPLPSEAFPVLPPQPHHHAFPTVPGAPHAPADPVAAGDPAEVVVGTGRPQDQPLTKAAHQGPNPEVAAGDGPHDGGGIQTGHTFREGSAKAGHPSSLLSCSPGQAPFKSRLIGGGRAQVPSPMHALVLGRLRHHEACPECRLPLRKFPQASEHHLPPFGCHCPGHPLLGQGQHIRVLKGRCERCALLQSQATGLPSRRHKWYFRRIRVCNFPLRYDR